MNGVIGIRASRPVSEPTNVAKPGVLAAVEVEELDERGAAVERLVRGYRRRHGAGVGIAEL